MDYPKSVPNVGLVGGKFVDENTATGQVGSLIPAKWGSGVTDEILNVIMGGGYAPDESNNGQLLGAIKELINDKIPDAMPKAGGPYYPKFSGVAVNAEVGGYNGRGGYIGWGSNASGTMQFICNKGGGNTGGFVWGSVSADNTSLGPLMYYNTEGLLTVPSLFVLGSTRVPTQDMSSNNSEAANTAFVKGWTSQYAVRDSISSLGLASGNKSQPYMRKETTGELIMLQPLKANDTALLSANGWSKNADTGEIIQWVEYALSDSPGTTLVDVTWPFQFPNQCLNVRSSVRQSAGSSSALSVAFYPITRTGSTARIEEWAAVVQSGLVLMVEARGF